MWTVHRTPGVAAFALLVTMAASPVFAQQSPAKPAAPVDPQAHFTMLQVEGGLMKLDTRTGKLSFCSTRAGGWACDLVPEERSAYEDEITRLNDRIATLERGNVPPGVPDIAKPPLASPPTAGAPEPKAGQGSGETAQKKPDAGDSTDDEDVRSHVDRAMDMAEHVFRRFFEMVQRLKGESEKL
jgi:hypothetical protein